MNTNENQNAPAGVTAAGVVSSPLLGSFALDPAHLGYAYCNAEYDHQMTGLFATAEDAEAEARIECRKGGWVSAVRAVDQNDDCAEDGWDFISYGPRKEIPSSACGGCVHWAGHEYPPAFDKAYCDVFDKFTTPCHGANCTAWSSPNTQPSGR